MYETNGNGLPKEMVNWNSEKRVFEFSQPKKLAKNKRKPKDDSNKM